MKTTLPPTERTYLLRSQIKPDPTQPRKTFAGLAELAASFGGTAEGILETLKVRADNGHYTLIDGERRWRAAELAKLERVPVEIIAPADVLKTQLLFATQRENLTALEEAAAYARLLAERRAKDSKFSVTNLAIELGRSRSSLYELLTLDRASAPVKEAMRAGKLDASKAALIANVVDQAGALKAALSGSSYGGEPSVRRLKEIIERDFQRQLSAAPWKHADAELLPKAGPCTTCPKRSGNIEGFAGQNQFICTDVACYAIKQEAHIARVLAESKKEGVAIVDPKQYEKRSYDYATPDRKPYQDHQQRTYAQLAKAAKIAPAVTVDEDGHRREVFTREQQKEILAANGMKESSGGAYRARERAATKKRQAQYQAAAQAATAGILEAFVPEKAGQQASGPAGLLPKLWPLLARAAYDCTSIDEHAFIAKRRGLAKTQNEAWPALEKWLKQTADAAALARFTLECLLCARWKELWRVKFRPDFLALCKLAGVKIEKLLAAAAPKAKAKAKRKRAGQPARKPAGPQKAKA